MNNGIIDSIRRYVLKNGAFHIAENLSIISYETLDNIIGPYNMAEYCPVDDGSLFVLATNSKDSRVQKFSFNEDERIVDIPELTFRNEMK